MKEINFLPEYVSELYGKKIVAFGTGKVGRVAIPYLVRDPKIDLVGVTNSRISEDIGKEFLDTQLPLKPLSVWREQYYDAVILITIIDTDYRKEAEEICVAAGFKKIIFLSYRLFCDISYAFINNLDQYLDSSYRLCKEFVAATSNPMLEAACMANEIKDLHTATFAEFKDCNRGRDAVVVGCGPTLNYYEPISKACHIGVNAAYKKDNINLDYLFVTDFDDSGKVLLEELKSYHFVQFYAQRISKVLQDLSHIPEDILERNHARRYMVSEQNELIHRDIQHYPLMYFDSTIFAAIHFAMYTRPKRIFLVGCDCEGISHFNGEPNSLISELIPSWKKGYEKVKLFVERNYRDTNIISINPRGLKGLFHDTYTGKYLESHPEIQSNEVEIM